MNESEVSTFWIAVAFLATAALSSLIVVVVLYKLAKKLIGLGRRIGNILGVDIGIKLVSFGLANMLFPAVLPLFMRAVFDFSLISLRELPSQFFQVWGDQKSLCQMPKQSFDCLANLGFGSLHAWFSTLDRAVSYARLNSLPYLSLLFLVTVWFVIAQLLRPLKESAPAGDSGQPTRPWLFTAFSRLDGVGKQNLLFFVIIVIASYLSLASIAAIPGLRGEVSAAAEVSVEKLTQSLDASLAQLPSATLPDATMTGPFARLEDSLSKARSSHEASSAHASESSSVGAEPAVPAPAKPQPPPEWLVQEIQVRLDRHKRVRENLLGAYKYLTQQANKEANAAKSEAFRTYTVSNADRQGRREQKDHFLQVSSWYSSQVKDLGGQIDGCANAIEVADSVWRNWAQIAQGWLVAPSNELNFAEWDRRMQERPVWRASDDALSACSRFRYRGSREVPPARPLLGSNLGPFRVVASWLLSTESLPLVLIVGLIGFGLLGAACSTFVRERATKHRRRRDAAIVEDLPSVVIRGLSAAIVVFLAVEGGLAIFSTGGSEPNPYVLLLTCLVASVFSEKVWDWAQEQLSEKLNSREEAGELPDKERNF